jgi:hypothetical protein
MTIPTLCTLCFNALAAADDAPCIDALPPQLCDEFARRREDAMRIRALEAERLDLHDNLVEWREDLFAIRAIHRRLAMIEAKRAEAHKRSQLVDTLPPHLLGEFTRSRDDVARARLLDAKMVELLCATQQANHETEWMVNLRSRAHDVHTELNEVRMRLRQ